MQRAYKLIWGKDVLVDLKLSKRNLRLQCERELKGKLLHLRQSFLENRASVKNLSDLIKKSLTTFAPVFRAVLDIVGIESPEKRGELLVLVSKRQKKRKVNKEEINRLFDRYVEEIDILILALASLSPFSNRVFVKMRDFRAKGPRSQNVHTYETVRTHCG